MKAVFFGILISASVAGPAYAESDETGYPRGSIGYEALVAGDNEAAIDQILTSNKISKHDPAKLINLGQAYARTGRIYEAQSMFIAALDKREAVDLILADGRVMNSHDAARQSLAKLQARMASR